MSWDSAVDFLKTYRIDRVKALNNEVRQKWSTEPLDELADFHNEIFDSTTENSDWSTLVATTDPPPSINKVQAVRLKISFLAGCRRDTGMMFEAWEGRRLRMPLDHDRFERSRLGFNIGKMVKLDQVIKTKEKSLV